MTDITRSDLDYIITVLKRALEENTLGYHKAVRSHIRTAIICLQIDMQKLPADVDADEMCVEG